WTLWPRRSTCCRDVADRGARRRSAPRHEPVTVAARIDCHPQVFTAREGLTACAGVRGATEGAAPMRRTITSLVVLGAALFSLGGSASAAPRVTFKAQAVPIPGFRHTGNIAGAGAAVKAEYTISGTEYGGFPPPLIGVTFYLPSGVKLHTSG